MSIYIKGNPSEGLYKLTYQDTTDKGKVAVLEGEDIAFIGQIVVAPHGRLIDADKAIKDYHEYGISHSYDANDLPDIMEDCPIIIEEE